MDDVAHQTEVVNALKTSLSTGNIPHLLFYGPPGTGKTSTILAICKQLYPPELIRERVLELNASDERGIAIVREKIKGFAQFTASGGSNVPGYPCPKWKIIILDEADSMTADAQTALRRTMELYSSVTRFCLICNYVSKIISPLASRCAKFRFKPLDGTTMQSRLEYVCKAENINSEHTADVVQWIMKVSGGDLRKAITYLQSTHTFYGDELAPKHIVRIAGIVPDEWVERFFDAVKSNSFPTLETTVSELLMQGFSAAQLLDQAFDNIMADKTLSDAYKSIILLKLSEIDRRLKDGCDEYIQLIHGKSLFST